MKTLEERKNHLMYKPLVAVITDREIRDQVTYDTIRTRYTEALQITAGVVPMLLPTNLSFDDVKVVLRAVNGVLLTGAESNVAPDLYGSTIGNETPHVDLARDKTAMATISFALSNGLPLLGICRGLQELNVALGGTLNCDISNGSSRMVHTEDITLPRDSQYDLAHDVLAVGSGPIAECIRCVPSQLARVNSLHAQGVQTLSSKLSIDAQSPDGVIEAVSVTSSHIFTASVQWHPEWFHSSDPLSQAILEAFGNSCRHHKKEEGFPL